MHLAIAKEEPEMVEFLLSLDDEGISQKERAFGLFFACHDQKGSRKPQANTELLEIPSDTNYEGLSAADHSVQFPDLKVFGISCKSVDSPTSRKSKSIISHFCKIYNSMVCYSGFLVRNNALNSVTEKGWPSVYSEHT